MIALRPADGEQDYREIFALLMVQHAEIGRAPLNPTKTGQYVYRVMSEGAAYIIEDDGKPIGTVGLSILEFWYSDARFWSEEWLFILPTHRDGAALRAVFAEMQVLGRETGLPVNVTIFNEKRAKAAGKIQRIAERFYFAPGGVSVIIPAGENQHGLVGRRYDDDAKDQSERKPSDLG
jgi:hypothetical protein